MKNNKIAILIAAIIIVLAISLDFYINREKIPHKEYCYTIIKEDGSYEFYDWREPVHPFKSENEELMSKNKKGE